MRRPSNYAIYNKLRPSDVGLDADKPAVLKEGGSYFATDTYKLYFGGKNGDFPFTVVGFPYYKLIDDDTGNNKVFRYYVDSSNGDDDNDGLNWATAKASINGAMEEIPFDMGGYVAKIGVAPGSTFTDTYINKRNGGILIEWCGSYLNESTKDYHIWLRNGRTDFTDDPITLTNTGNNKSLTTAGSEISIEFTSRDSNYNPTQAGYGYAERWIFETTGSAIVIGNYIGYGSSNLVIFAGKFDATGATWNMIENARSNMRLVDPAFYGDGAGASNKSNNDWGGFITNASSDGSQIFGKFGGGYAYASGYEAKAVNGIYAKDIKQLFELGSYTGSGMEVFMENFIYEDDLASFGGTIYRSSSVANSYNWHYHSDFVVLDLNDTNNKVLKDIKDDTIYNYVNSNFISNGDNVVLPNLPTSDPAIAGALWNDTGTVKVSAGP